MNELFSAHRFGLLLRTQFVASYRSILTLSLTLLLIHCVFALLTNDSQRVYISTFTAMLHLLGVILASRAFRELHDKHRNSAYLLLPASSIEKTLVRLLSVTLGLFIYLLLLSLLASCGIETLRYFVFGNAHALFNPLDSTIWRMLPGYFIVQSTFFLGAAWFRSGHLIKTTLTIGVSGMGLIIFSWLMMKLILQPYWNNMHRMSTAAETLFASYGDLFTSSLYLLAALWTVVCWYVAWLRVKETQVCDGV